MKRLTVLMLFVAQISFGQNIWDVSTYPDEAGFKKRMAPMLERIAAKSFANRSRASSTCPDTGLPVKTLALKGETIFSPYTGRAYVQGNTGYFGPKKRNAEGKIVAFGGDALKYELSPAAASIFLGDKNANKAFGFLSIPGNLRQQYHFACSNWARAYPLISDKFSDEWKSEFYHWIDAYKENTRPSDGYRDQNKIQHPHSLVGQEGELLGGNAFDGGTENHKTMWRTSALLYSQILPDSAKVSGYPLKKAEALTKKMISDYLKRMMYVGNGEYDSEVYYPYSIKSFMNLYDFSPDPQTKELAKLALDLYFVTFGLKVIDGEIAGAQKRGYLANKNPDMMDIMQWAFFDDTSRDMDNVVTTMHQATTTYRPNQVIWNIVKKNLSQKIFEGKMSRPFYHMDKPNSFAETFYCSENFALGNMQMTIVDNPNQQVVWSAVAKGTNGPLCFSGGQPCRGSTSGHSPYTQTLHSKGSLILLTAPTELMNADTSGIAKTYKKLGRNNLWIMPKSEQPKKHEMANRQKYAGKVMHEVGRPDPKNAEAIETFWKESKGSASSWLYFPKALKPELENGNYYFEANDAFIAIIPFSKDHFVLNPDSGMVGKFKSRETKKFFESYGIISFQGERSGYVFEVAEKSKFKSLGEFVKAIEKNNGLNLNSLTSNRVLYKSIYGDRMDMRYNPIGLRCKGIINGKTQNWDRLTKGAVYQSPYLTMKDGVMKISDGKDSYVVDFTGEKPIWKLP